MKKYFLIIVLLFTLVSTSFVSAQTLEVNNGGGTLEARNPAAGTRQIPTLQNPLHVNTFEDLLYSVIDVLIFVGVIVATLMFVFIGFKFVMAQGDPKGLEAARAWFFYTVIGTAILLGSKVVVEVVKNTFISAGVVDERSFNKP